MGTQGYHIARLAADIRDFLVQLDLQVCPSISTLCFCEVYRLLYCPVASTASTTPRPAFTSISELIYLLTFFSFCISCFVPQLLPEP